MTKTLQKSSLWLLCLILLSACMGSTDYFKSVDVDHDAWSVTDSVLFPIHVVDNPDVNNPVKWGVDYNLTLSSRHSCDYPYQQLPVIVCLQQEDSLGWKTCQQRFKITIPTADKEGHLDGGGWGSLYKKEMLVTGRKIRFPEPGDYRIVVLPDTLLHGVVSITIELD